MLRRQFIKDGASLAAVGLVWSGWPVRAQDPLEPVIYVCPMHPDIQSKLPGKCQKCNMALVATRGTGSAKADSFYTCPMHPDVFQSGPGTCPKCNMKLVRAAPPEAGDFTVRIETVPRAPKAGEKVRFRFSIFNPVSGKQVRDFNIMHDMPFHLFVISQDFGYFRHIHPEKQSDGSFVIEEVLEKPGYYKIFCDFFPVGGMPQVTRHSLVTAGYDGDLMSSQARLEPDRELVRTLEGTRFELRLEPSRPFAGKPAELHYRLTDEKTGQPVTDLAPYLGAWGHTLILSEDATDYLHSHPTEMIAEDLDRSNLRGGPDVVFDTFFPRPGNYKIWSQFQRGARLITVSFAVNIPRLK